ncbi:condensation domain-containing protein [Microbacterium enclense]|uniref:condensation domain-containing protein n=1 Tax=Microbacterium enclense TaxID=993073 RepID=UPI003F7FC826
MPIVTADLAEMFASILGRRRFHPDESFFEAGGDSLAAARLIGRIRGELGVAAEPRMLFLAPTPRLLTQALAAAVAPLPEPIRVLPRPRLIPLAPSQRRLWFIHQLRSSEDVEYNMPLAFTVDGELAEAPLAAALCDLVRAHEALRTRILTVDGRPVQEVALVPSAADILEIVSSPDESYRAIVTRLAMTPFDLAADLPFRAVLVRRSPTEHLLVLIVHHIVCDGWSLLPLASDLSTAYRARLRDLHAETALNPPEVQLADYAVWADARDRTTASRVQSEEERRWWAEHLAGLPRPRALDIEHRTHGGERQGRVISRRLSARIQAAVHATARAAGGTPFMVLHAALAVLLWRNGAGEDTCIGAPVAGRQDERVERTIGFFVNTLALRLRVVRSERFSDLLGRAIAADTEATSRQRLPFDQVVAAANPPDRRLFRVMLAYQGLAAAPLDLSPARVERLEGFEESPKFPLRFEVTERFDDRGLPGGIDLVLTHPVGALDDADGEGLIDEFVKLLDRFVDEPESSIAVDMSSPRPRPLPSHHIAFVFSPYGQQWVGMGRTLYSTSDAFREAVDEIDAATTEAERWSPLRYLLGNDQDSRDVQYVQPVLFALQVGFVAHLADMGIYPDVVIGHSMGEFAALVASGMLDAATAARAICRYSARQAELVAAGSGMAVFTCDRRDLASITGIPEHSWDIACENGPTSTAVSARRDTLIDMVRAAEDHGVDASLIDVPLGAHSAFIDPIVSAIQTDLDGLSAASPRVPMVSTLTGAVLEADALSASYLAQNLRRRVRLREGIETVLTTHECDILLEVSAHPVLSTALSQSVAAAGSPAEVWATGRRGPDERRGFRLLHTRLGRR